MPARINYNEAFRELLDAVPAGRRIPFRDIASASHFNVTVDTVKKHFKAFIDGNPSYLSRITGFFPKPETIIALVEQEIGPIMESNLDLANVESSKIVKGVARPMVEEFIHEGLSGSLDQARGEIRIGMGALSDFLIDDFSEFLRSSGNGLVSIAGGLNELLLIQAMKNAGMRDSGDNKDFTRTGKDSKADVVVHSHVGTKSNLAVEVKSYHARERLLRGLRDISVPKIGVGYFKDPAEFNPTRTRTLLQAQPAAIYMPRTTLDRLPEDSRKIKTMETAAYGCCLYRPLEQFVTDMRWFNAHGALPKYP